MEPKTQAPSEDEEELDALRERVEALEQARLEQAARTNAAIAAAQERSYWLDRWHLDLNALMRKRGAAEARAAFRAIRSVYRFVNDRRGKFRERVQTARVKLEEERVHGTAPHPDERFRRSVSPDSLRRTPITDTLYARLDAEDVKAVEARLEPSEAALWETADAPDRKRLTLAFAAHYGVEPALEHSGLNAEMPPPEVHSMARSPAAAGGSTYYADLVVDAFERAGLTPAAGQSWLDLGCSSGRVVRVLAAALPELDWHGCDPIPDAIEWAQSHLPGIQFVRSPEYPPLPYGEASFDAIFAISIWSHFSERAALDWFAEMGRILKPGGRLLVTTHGAQTIAHTFRIGQRSPEQLQEVRDALYERGFWYAPEFGEKGDHGVANPDWGTAFLSPEWLMARLSPEWRIAFFAPGRVEENQDLYVLERG